MHCKTRMPSRVDFSWLNSGGMSTAATTSSSTLVASPPSPSSPTSPAGAASVACASAPTSLPASATPSPAGAAPGSCSNGVGGKSDHRLARAPHNLSMHVGTASRSQCASGPTWPPPDVLPPSPPSLLPATLGALPASGDPPASDGSSACAAAASAGAAASGSSAGAATTSTSTGGASPSPSAIAATTPHSDATERRLISRKKPKLLGWF